MRRHAFTLIEILIAMAVFLIGMVAIIGIFPAGIKSSEKSTDQSVAAAVAESLEDALTLSLRSYDGTVTSNVWFYHDGLPVNAAIGSPKGGRDFFRLPQMETWVSGATTYTCNGRSKPTWYPYRPGTLDTSADETAFSEAANANVRPAILASITDPNGKGGNLTSLVGPAGAIGNQNFPDPLGQYAFRFMCHEYKTPNDADADEVPYSNYDPPDPDGGGALPDPPLLTNGQFSYQNGIVAEVVDRLYQFTIYIYRGWKPSVTTELTTDPFLFYTQTGPSAGNTSPNPGYQWMDQMKHPDFRERFEFTIYAPGAR